MKNAKVVTSNWLPPTLTNLITRAVLDLSASFIHGHRLLSPLFDPGLWYRHTGIFSPSGGFLHCNVITDLSNPISSSPPPSPLQVVSPWCALFVLRKEVDTCIYIRTHRGRGSTYILYIESWWKQDLMMKTCEESGWTLPHLIRWVMQDVHEKQSIYAYVKYVHIYSISNNSLNSWRMRMERAITKTILNRP